MSIYRINTNLALKSQIELLNKMILEINGKVEQGKFSSKEVDQIISDTGIDTKYIRAESLGHTLTTYSNWSHVFSKSGYSIWKIAPSNYTYSSYNLLFLDDYLIENKGQANSETSSFDKVYLYNGSSYTDNTTEAATTGGTEFNLMDSTSDYLYIGLDSTFSGIKFEFQTRGSNYSLKLEYYDESSGVNDWVELTANSNNLEDNTSNFESDGLIEWDIPSNWGLTTVNSVSKYWIRISTTSTPVTTAKAYYIVPGNSVEGLLALSSDEIFNEKWRFCSYNDYIYVTIRDSGNSAYEGNYYIKSSSSTANKKNFFIYNHEYKAYYQDSTYTGRGIVLKNRTSDPSDPVEGEIWIRTDL